MLLETYTTLKGEKLRNHMPTFLNLGPEVTGDSAFSMFNLSLKEDWVNSKKFCHRLSDDDDTSAHGPATQEAQERLDANKSRQGSPNSGLSVAPSTEEQIDLEEAKAIANTFIPVK